jgi:hypothetical protein
MRRVHPSATGLGMLAANGRDLLEFRRRLNETLTADLVATPTPLERAISRKQTDADLVWQQMQELGFDVLPVDNTMKRYWSHPRGLPAMGANGPILRSLSAADLLAASTPVLEVLRLMVTHGRRFYFTLSGHRRRSRRIQCLDDLPHEGPGRQNPQLLRRSKVARHGVESRPLRLADAFNPHC